MEILVNIDVDDLESAIRFYTSGLGLRLSKRLFDGTVAEMTGASSTIHLLLKPAGSIAVESSGDTREYRRHWTPVHLDFVVDDLSAVVQRVVGAGGRLEGEITAYSWGQLATIADPFGHGLCVLQYSERQATQRGSTSVP